MYNSSKLPLEFINSELFKCQLLIVLSKTYVDSMYNSSKLPLEFINSELFKCQLLIV